MVLIKGFIGKLTVSGKEGNSGTGGTGTSSTTNTVDVVLRVVGVVIVQHMSNVAHIFWKGGFVSKQSISGFMRSMAMKDPFSVVQDLMHHCSLGWYENREANPWDGGSPVVGNLGNAASTVQKQCCVRKTSTLLSLSHKKLENQSQAKEPAAVLHCESKVLLGDHLAKKAWTRSINGV